MGGRGDWPAAAAPWLSNNFTAISATGWVARMAGVASHKLCSHARLKRGLEAASKEFIAGGIKGDQVMMADVVQLHAPSSWKK